jgi:hypothetical protein
MFFSLPFFGVPLYEMLMDIGVEVFVSLLMCQELMMGFSMMELTELEPVVLGF